jgi:hypothetical protein
MARRRVLRLVAAFLLVAGSALVAFGAPAGAGDLADSGWWYVRPGLTGQPPTVPAGGLYVAGAPDGAIAIAAVRFTLSEDETEPKLTLEVATPAPSEGEEGEEPAPAPVPVPGGAPAPAPGAPAPPAEAAPVILACQAGAGWSGVEAGSADAAPPPACGAGSVVGTPSADGLSWEWDLSKLQIKTAVDVILVAGKVKDLPEGANGSTFQLAFAKPTAESLDTIEGSAPEPFTPPGGGDFGGAPDLAEGGAADGFASGSGSIDTGGGVSFDAGDDTTSEGPALPEEQQGLTPTAPLVQAQQPAPEVAGAQPAGSTRDTRWLGIVVVLLAGVVAVMANNQPVPPLRGLGPFRREVPAEAVAATTPAAGGLGRFAKSRSGAAPRL